MSRRTLPLAVLVLALPAGATAQEDTYRHGRIRHAESGVSIQRATEPGAEEAVGNMPFLPGDRVWSDAHGRAEFQFADGTLLRLDRGSKLDYIAHEEGEDDERVILRLWSGALVLHPRDARNSPEFAVETPGGVMVAEQRGVYRVDVDAGETRLSVYEGEAVLEADRRLRLKAGERAYARAGEAYGEAERFDRGEGDEFARWDADRQGEVGLSRRTPEYLPEDISPYADELDGHGTWYYEADIGHVWRPYVDPGWRPYQNGRWMWTSYGWTWLPYETWGWAPSHYGRWGHTASLGWYWMPGRSWGPAWVDWAVGNDYVGWCPTGWRDGYVPGRSRDRGWAIPRGTGGNAWVYARRGDMSARDLPRRVAMDVAVPRNMTLLEPRARVTRDLRVVDAARAAGTGDVRGHGEARAHAVPRNVRTNPTPGDTTPELRSDPATTIPFPTARRRYESAREREEAERETAARVRTTPRHDTAAAPAAATGEAAAPAAPRAVPTHPATPFQWTARPRARRPAADAAPQTRPRDGEHAGAHSPEADRDVMRPVFRPLSRPRAGGGSGEAGSRDEGARRNDAGARQRGGDSGWGRTPQVERPADRPERSAPRPERSEPRAQDRGERRGGHGGGGGGGGAAGAAPRSSGGGGGGDERAAPRSRRERQ